MGIHAWFLLSAVVAFGVFPEGTSSASQAPHDASSIQQAVSSLSADAGEKAFSSVAPQPSGQLPVVLPSPSATTRKSLRDAFDGSSAYTKRTSSPKPPVLVTATLTSHEPAASASFAHDETFTGKPTAVRKSNVVSAPTATLLPTKPLSTDPPSSSSPVVNLFLRQSSITKLSSRVLQETLASSQVLEDGSWTMARAKAEKEHASLVSHELATESFAETGIPFGPDTSSFTLPPTGTFLSSMPMSTNPSLPTPIVVDSFASKQKLTTESTSALFIYAYASSTKAQDTTLALPVIQSSSRVPVGSMPLLSKSRSAPPSSETTSITSATLTKVHFVIEKAISLPSPSQEHTSLSLRKSPSEDHPSHVRLTSFSSSMLNKAFHKPLLASLSPAASSFEVPPSSDRSTQQLPPPALLPSTEHLVESSSSIQDSLAGGASTFGLTLSSTVSSSLPVTVSDQLLTSVGPTKAPVILGKSMPLLSGGLRHTKHLATSQDHSTTLPGVPRPSKHAATSQGVSSLFVLDQSIPLPGGSRLTKHLVTSQDRPTSLLGSPRPSKHLVTSHGASSHFVLDQSIPLPVVGGPRSTRHLVTSQDKPTSLPGVPRPSTHPVTGQEASSPFVLAQSASLPWDPPSTKNPVASQDQSTSLPGVPHPSKHLVTSHGASSVFVLDQSIPVPEVPRSTKHLVTSQDHATSLAGVPRPSKHLATSQGVPSLFVLEQSIPLQGNYSPTKHLDTSQDHATSLAGVSRPSKHLATSQGAPSRFVLEQSIPLQGSYSPTKHLDTSQAQPTSFPGVPRPSKHLDTSQEASSRFVLDQSLPLPGIGPTSKPLVKSLPHDAALPSSLQTVITSSNMDQGSIDIFSTSSFAAKTGEQSSSRITSSVQIGERPSSTSLAIASTKRDVTPHFSATLSLLSGLDGASAPQSVLPSTSKSLEVASSSGVITLVRNIEPSSPKVPEQTHSTLSEVHVTTTELPGPGEMYRYEVTMTIVNRDYDTSLENHNSAAFKRLAQEVEHLADQALRTDVQGLLFTKVHSFNRGGSIKCHLTVFVRKTSSTTNQIIGKAFGSNLGNFKIVGVYVVGPTGPNGLLPSDEVQIFPASFKITNKEFTQELTDPSSVQFKRLASELEHLLNYVFDSILGFLYVEIESFSSGSVICDFVIYSKMDSIEKPGVFKKALIDAINNGQTRNFAITSVEVNDITVGAVKAEKEDDPKLLKVVSVTAFAGVVALVIVVLVVKTLKKRTRRRGDHDLPTDVVYPLSEFDKTSRRTQASAEERIPTIMEESREGSEEEVEEDDEEGEFYRNEGQGASRRGLLRREMDPV